MSNNQVVREFVIPDGIGAQFWRKIYAMSYAKYNGLYFQETPITNFLIHESDNVTNEEEKQKLISDFYKFINMPWPKINQDILSACSDYPGIGAGATDTQGRFVGSQEFLSCASEFNTVNEKDNSIVIHIRRGNVIKENPRWIDDSVYVGVLKNIEKIKSKYSLVDPDVIILTDAPDEDKMYKPINNEESLKWRQPYLHANENGEYLLKSVNFKLLKSEYPNLKIVNNLSTYDSFLLMLRANVLVVSKSAFSMTAGVLSKNNVIAVDSAYFGLFSTLSGLVDPNGNISFLQ